MIGKILVFAFSGLAIGCGGSVYEITSDADGGDVDGGRADSGADASHHDSGVHDSATQDSGPFACGKTICGGSDYCVHPCCGGAPPPCLPVNDGGGCPSGSTFESSCGFGTPGPGCRPDPCTPPQPYCSPKADVCGPPQSGSRDVSCLCG